MIIQTVTLFENAFQFVCRDVVDGGVVRIEMPEEGVEGDVAFDKEIFNVRADDAVVEFRLPDRSTGEKSGIVYALRYRGFERTDDCRQHSRPWFAKFLSREFL